MSERKQSDKLPSKLSMIRSATKQLYSSARSVKQGLPVFVSPNIAQERFEICNDLADAKCPIGKWGKHE